MRSVHRSTARHRRKLHRLRTTLKLEMHPGTLPQPTAPPHRLIKLHPTQTEIRCVDQHTAALCCVVICPAASGCTISIPVYTLGRGDGVRFIASTHPRPPLLPSSARHPTHSHLTQSDTMSEQPEHLEAGEGVRSTSAPPSWRSIGSYFAYPPVAFRGSHRMDRLVFRSHTSTHTLSQPPNS